MDVAARVTCKGQITIPKAIRDALGIEDGDQVIFRVDGDRAVIARTPNLLTLGAVGTTPAVRRGTAWDDVIVRAQASRTKSGAADRRAGVVTAPPDPHPKSTRRAGSLAAAAKGQ